MPPGTVFQTQSRMHVLMLWSRAHSVMLHVHTNALTNVFTHVQAGSAECQTCVAAPLTSGVASRVGLHSNAITKNKQQQQQNKQWGALPAAVDHARTTVQGKNTHLSVAVDRTCSTRPATPEQPTLPPIRGACGAFFDTPTLGRATSCQKPPANLRCTSTTSIGQRTFRFNKRRNLILSRILWVLSLPSSPPPSF